ncbi:YcxB family protein [Hyphomonas sp.]|uniref:YcxB family protein n=1 Tax=Hyphomonas sp. TaxID=87 RepID=UPI0032EDB9D2|tara:strand:+ start:22 stop:549 length:528 start_codon:yes stop_codon:yes gene_type:complete
MSQTLNISGLLREKDVKRLTRLTRGGSVGPTAVYYAGVTAPIISASMAVMVREAMRLVGLSPYWQWFISAFIAAFAGIAWYLIFIRWSYRHKHGRGTEMTLSTDITLGDDQIIVRRGGIETRIDWSCISSVKAERRHVAVLVNGADSLIIPDAWFGKDKSARAAFISRLQEKVPH